MGAGKLRDIAVGGMLGLTLTFSQPAIAQKDITTKIEEVREFGKEHSALIEQLRRDYGFSSFRISPDKKRIAFVSDDKEGNYEVYVSDLEGKTNNITHHRADDHATEWIDNYKVSFFSDRTPISHKERKYIVNADGSGLELSRETKEAIAKIKGRNYRIFGGVFGALLGFYFFYDMYRRRRGENVPGFLKSIYYGLTAKSIEDIEKVRGEFPNWSTVYWNLGGRHLEEGNLDLMLENFTKAMELRQNDLVRKIPIIGSLSLSHALERLEQKKITKNEPIRGNIGLAMLDYVDFRFDKAILTTQEAMQHWKSVYAHAFFGYLLDNIRELYDERPRPFVSFGETRVGKAIDRFIWRKRNTKYTKPELEEMANREWQRTLELIVEDPKTKDSFRSLEEGHEVYTVGPSEYMRNIFVFKKSAENKLRKERELIELTGQTIKQEHFAAVRPITIVPFGEDFYLITMHAPGKRLFDYLEETRDLEPLRKTNEYLALFHALMPVEGMESRKYKREFEERMAVLPDKVRERLMRDIAVVYDFDWLPLVMNRDAHPYNWLVDEDGNIIALDIEPKGKIPGVFDNAKLYFQGGYITTDKRGDNILDGLASSYLRTFNENATKKIRDEERYLTAVLRSTAFRSVIYHCFAFSNPETESVRKEFLQHGMHAIDRLQDEFRREFSDTQMNQFDELKNSIEILYNL